MMDESDLTFRLAYRAGSLDGLGWPFNRLVRQDIDLHREAARFIGNLRAELIKAAEKAGDR